MADTYLEKLLKERNERNRVPEVKADAATERENAEWLRKSTEFGRSGARTDFPTWREAIEDKMSFFSYVSASADEFHRKEVCIYYDKEKSFFGGSKSVTRRLYGFENTVIAADSGYSMSWKAVNEGYTDELKKLFGHSFTADITRPGKGTSREYYNGVEHAVGSESYSFYDETYDIHWSVSVRWPKRY